MSSAKTRSKLITVITKEIVENFNTKLKIQDICESVGITRQSFNRYYSDLKPYMKGEKPINELVMNQSDISSNQLLCKYQSKIKELQDELEDIVKSHEIDLSKVKNSMTTSLMNNDLSVHDADNVRLQLQKQSLHSDKLKEKINRLEVELSKQYIDNNLKSSTTPLNDNFQVIDVDFELLFKNFSATQDIDVFEDEKEVAIDNLISMTNKLLINDKTIVVLFMERYLSSFNKFVERYAFNSEDLHLFVRLPVHSRSELKLTLNKFNKQGALKIYIPYSASDTVTKSQRNFYFRNVPETELQAADKSFLPSIKDGFEHVCQFKIRQGD